MRCRSTAASLALPLLTLALLTAACAAEVAAPRRIQPDDCLRNLKLNALEQALRRCDRVVASFPSDPAPLNERFVLHSLQGNPVAACRDIAQAQALARALPAERLPLQLRTELQVRQESCP
ncbi:MAG: hypothetical protein R6W06_10285 [Prochlorococcaceae cyanobacterium]